MMQFTAVGDSVNTASRLCGVAGPGEVIVSEATLEATGAYRGDIRVETRGEVELKGTKARLKVYNVLSVEGDAASEDEPTQAASATIPKSQAESYRAEGEISVAQGRGGASS
jgi:class 3 adenylate cyclase